MADQPAVNEPVATQDATPTESAPVENNVPEVVDEQARADKEIAESLSKVETEDAPKTEAKAEEPKPAEETNTEEQPQGEEKPLSPKGENRFQTLANKNREYEEKLADPAFLQEQLGRLKLQESQLATEQELLNEVNPETGEYYTPQEVERLAFQQAREQQQQSIAQERYQLEVQQNQQVISSEAKQALQDFPVFDSESSDYKEELAAQADELLGKSLITDQNGTIVGSNVSPYQIYKLVADAMKVSAEQGQIKAQKATEKMLSRVDSTSNAGPPKEAENDLFLKGLLGENQK